VRIQVFGAVKFFAALRFVANVAKGLSEITVENGTVGFQSRGCLEITPSRFSITLADQAQPVTHPGDLVKSLQSVNFIFERGWPCFCQPRSRLRDW